MRSSASWWGSKVRQFRAHVRASVGAAERSELEAQIPQLVLLVVALFVYINLVLMLFNLLPIPPLDGSKVLFAFLSPRFSWQWRPVLEQYGFILILLLFFLPPGNSIGSRIFFPILNALFNLLVGG